MPITAAKPPVPVSRRLSYRDFVDDDADVVAESCASWEAVRYTSSIPHPYPSDGAAAFIRNARAKREADRFYVFAAWTEHDSRFVGQVGLTRMEQPRVAEISYLLAPSFWGQGYATEMVRAVLDFGFDTMELDTVVARVFVENEASGGVLKKVGIVKGESSWIDAPARGRRVAVDWYRIDRGVWRGRGA